MNQEAANELLGRQLHGLPLTAVSIVLVAEGDRLLADAEQTLIPNDQPPGVPSQVLERGFSIGRGVFGQSLLRGRPLLLVGNLHVDHPLASSQGIQPWRESRPAFAADRSPSRC